MRIQKYLSQKGVLSRREAEAYILKGLIKVNGKIVRRLGTQIDPEKDRLEVVSSRGTTFEKLTVAVYKPRGVVSSKIPREGRTIFQLLPQFKNLNVVGRIDKDSEGLLLLSNDGPITAAVTGNDHRIEKEYEVTVRETVTSGKVAAMARGLLLEDGPTLPTKTKRISAHVFRITLREGRKHQIRRMANAVQLTVTGLKRIRIGFIGLGDMKPTEWRKLSPRESEMLKRRE